MKKNNNNCRTIIMNTKNIKEKLENGDENLQIKVIYEN